MALIGFFDILGTKAAISSGRFSDLTSLDFAGPACLAAKLFPNIRISIFSDSVIVSAESGNYHDFLKAVSLMYGNWWADFILVRGGIAEGEIRWIDYEPIDTIFSSCKNLSCSRVYGEGLVLAFETEQRSGPGAIPYFDRNCCLLTFGSRKKQCVARSNPYVLLGIPKTSRAIVKECQLELRLRDTARQW